MPPRRSPLDAAHRAGGAKMAEFGGWDMPLAFPAGTLAEHLACRRHAVAFDVSHLGTVRVRGDAALDRLQATFTNDLAKIGPGRSQYTHLLDDDGGVLDDLIVWWIDATTFDVMPNASNTARVLAALGGPGVSVGDVTGERAVIAIQGPHARASLAAVAPEATAVRRGAVIRFSWRGVECVAAGTGYTGEDGVEVAVPADAADGLWKAVLDRGIAPAGLGARDTLRLEAGLPLHGHELGPGITPLQAGLGWVVAWHKPAFCGRTALLAERERGVGRALRAIVTDGRQPPRSGNGVRLWVDEASGTVPGTPGGVGVVTSGNFSPLLERGIALAFCPPTTAPGTRVSIDARGRPLAGKVVSLPFVPRGT